MTPIQLEILLHYYARANDFEDGDFSASAVRAAIEHFKASELLAVSDGNSRATYAITERGRVYVKAVLALPLPERRWVMPSAPRGEDVTRTEPPGSPD